MTIAGQAPRLMPDGRWLLRRHGRRWVLPPAVVERWRDRDDGCDLIRLLDASPPGRAELRGGPRWRWAIVPGARVDAVAKRLAPWTAWPVLVAGLAGGAAVLAVGAWATTVAGAHWPTAVAVLVPVLAIHELGHAAALRRGGGRPGPIGVGLSFVVPALWCDVSEVALLPRRDRLRVDLAGLAWQAALGGVIVLAGLVMQHPSLALAARFVAVSAVWSLMPLGRTDGSWALADAVGLSDLESPHPPGSGLGRRIAAAGVRGSAVAATMAFGFVVSWRMVGIGCSLWESGPMRVLCIPLGAAGVVGVQSMTRRIRVLVSAMRIDLFYPSQSERGDTSMPAIDRPTTPDQLLTRLAEGITATEALLHPLTPADLERRDGGWTVAEVLEHVCLTVDQYMVRMGPALEKAEPLTETPNARAMKTSLVGRLLAGGVDPASKRRLKAPGRFAPSPEPRHDIVTETLRLHTDLIELLKSVSDRRLDGRPFGTPVSSLLRVNAWDAFLVLTLHLERHLGQIRRILAS